MIDKWKELKRDLNTEIKQYEDFGYWGGERVKHNKRILHLMEVIEKEERGEYK